MVMVESFKYRVDGNHPEATLHVSQHFWPRLTKGCCGVWHGRSLPVHVCVLFARRRQNQNRGPPRAEKTGLTIPSLIGLLVSLLLVVIGLFVVNFSLVWSTVWLRPDTRKWREIRPFTTEGKHHAALPDVEQKRIRLTLQHVPYSIHVHSENRAIQFRCAPGYLSPITCALVP